MYTKVLQKFRMAEKIASLPSKSANSRYFSPDRPYVRRILNIEVDGIRTATDIPDGSKSSARTPVVLRVGPHEKPPEIQPLIGFFCSMHRLHRAAAWQLLRVHDLIAKS